MKKVAALALGCLWACVQLLQPGVALAKSYHIVRTHIEAVLEPDGSLRLTERRTFRFEGDFSQVYQEIDLPERSQVTDLTLDAFREANDKQPGTFSLSETGDGVRVDWHIQARDTEQTYTLAYRIANAARISGETAQLHWDLIGGEWQVPADLVEIRLTLPEAPLGLAVEPGGAAVAQDGRVVRITLRNLPDRQPLTVRADLPRSAFSADVPAPEPTPPAADLVMQAGWAIVTAVSGLWFYLTRVRRPRDAYNVPPSPEPLAPVLLARLRDQAAPVALRVALLDLSQRGKLRIEPEGDDWRFTRTGDAGTLEAYEREALNCFFGPQRESITLAEWKAKRGNSNQVYERLNRWHSALEEQLPAGWVLPYRWETYLLSVTGVAVLLLTEWSLLSVLVIVLMLVLVLLGFFQHTRSEAAVRQEQAWREMGEAMERRLGALGAGDLPVALALGLAVGQHLDPTAPLGWELKWFRDTTDAIDAWHAAQFNSGSDAGSVDSGSDGGGGGGAQ